MNYITNSVTSFLIESSLYDSFELSDTSVNDFLAMISGHEPVDCFCCKCAEKRVFHSTKTIFALDEEEYDYNCDANAIRQEYQRRNYLKPDSFNLPSVFDTFGIRAFIQEFSCTMDPTHKLHFAINIEGSNIRKIGQFPSVADLSVPSLKKYDKVLDDNLIAELKRGIGLHAHGIGAGSYIYLRRVFESLISEAEKEAVKDHPDLSNSLNNARMAEKINLLEHYLPVFLVKNRQVFKILSKGVHELSEKECNSYFDVLLNAIFLILDEKKALVDKIAMERDIEKNLNDISSVI